MEKQLRDKTSPKACSKQKKVFLAIVSCVLLLVVVLTCVFWPQVHTQLIYARIRLELQFGTMTYADVADLMGAEHTATSSSMAYKQWDLPDGRFLWCGFVKPRDENGNFAINKDNYPDALILISAEITTRDHTYPPVKPSE